ncbi:hypothetical protein [Cyanobium sp. Tous-M-B4]|nr:hypothetical protein [Cyanobium sp. Tous-M-B4]MCP9876602.1 hypothetical protein [Cyanobium sp. A2C-AMD]
MHSCLQKLSVATCAGITAISVASGGIYFMQAPARAAEEFTDLQCLSDINSKDICNVSFYRKFMKVNFVRTGRSVKINYGDIVHWNYSDSSLRKRDWDLAGRIGIIGLLFTKVEHIHVFTIVYRDEFGDRQTTLLDFDNKQYVLPMKAALAEAKEIN